MVIVFLIVALFNSFLCGMEEEDKKFLPYILDHNQNQTTVCLRVGSKEKVVKEEKIVIQKALLEDYGFFKGQQDFGSNESEIPVMFDDLKELEAAKKILTMESYEDLGSKDLQQMQLVADYLGADKKITSNINCTLLSRYAKKIQTFVIGSESWFHAYNKYNEIYDNSDKNDWDSMYKKAQEDGLLDYLYNKMYDPQYSSYWEKVVKNQNCYWKKNKENNNVLNDALLKKWSENCEYAHLFFKLYGNVTSLIDASEIRDWPNQVISYYQHDFRGYSHLPFLMKSKNMKNINFMIESFVFLATKNLKLRPVDFLLCSQQYSHGDKYFNFHFIGNRLDYFPIAILNRFPKWSNANSATSSVTIQFDNEETVKTLFSRDVNLVGMTFKDGSQKYYISQKYWFVSFLKKLFIISIGAICLALLYRDCKQVDIDLQKTDIDNLFKNHVNSNTLPIYKWILNDTSSLYSYTFTDTEVMNHARTYISESSLSSELCNPLEIDSCYQQLRYIGLLSLPSSFNFNLIIGLCSALYLASPFVVSVSSVLDSLYRYENYPSCLISFCK